VLTLTGRIGDLDELLDTPNTTATPVSATWPRGWDQNEVVVICVER
jgi:hypothetical protein